ncbi:MAG TPA: nuclear transport factor 2 family protein [Kofleriaceae bacterium]|nr:nuclear transport factor 2 family protein [Kofleriaceae bacterium]
MQRSVRIGLLLAGLACVAGCKKDKEEGDKAAVDDPKAAKTSEAAAGAAGAAEPVTGEALIQRIEGCWASYVAWDKEAFRACYAEKTEVGAVDAIPPQTARTPQEVVVLNGTFRNAFPDFAADIQLILVNGKKVASVVLQSGTHKGRSLGMPPTNKKMMLYYGEAREVDDRGLTVSERAYADQTTLLQQLGLQEGLNAPTKEEPWPAKVRAVARNDAGESANLAAFKTSFDALSKGDAAGSSAIYASDATYRYLPQSVVITGPKEIAKARDYSAVAKPLEMTVRDAWAAGDWVVAETTIKGTLSNDVGGVKGTKGKTWEQTSFELLEFAQGKVKRHLVFVNGLKFATDVGLFDPAELGM